MASTELDLALRLVQILAIPLLGAIAWQLNALRSTLEAFNARVVALETWKTSHDKQDDERHLRVTGDLEKVVATH